MDKIKDIVKEDKYVEKKILKNAKYVTKEYQDYGYRLALNLDDKKRVALYIKLAKDKPRVLLERAYSFAIDYPNAKNKAGIFMWKLKDLEKEQSKKKKDK